MSHQRSLQRSRSVSIALIILAAPLVLCGAAAGGDLGPARADTMVLQLLPHATELAAGDTLHVDLVVPVAGLPFNAYDAFVGYDPEVFTFLQQPAGVQQGPLMTDVCGQTFHLFTIAPDSTHLEINHSLLCPGEELTGPGVVYRLLFRCKDVDRDTWLRLLIEPPTQTRAYNAGLFVQPLATIDAAVRVGAGSGTAVPGAPPAGLRLHAAPNPFNPQTVFTFVLADAAVGELGVYGLDGRLLRTLAVGRFAAGEHTARWDGKDGAGRSLAAGVYLARLRTGSGAVTTRVCLVR